jgi:hypothetical protein
MKRQYRLERMKAIEREYKVARVADRIFQQALRADPDLLFGDQLKPADARTFSENLEATYLLRLFAEFEEGLRDLWRNGYKKTKKTLTYDLIERVAAKRTIPADDKDKAHAVREYRNSIIHEEGAKPASVPFADARKCLCTYFSRLPPDW